MVYEAYSKVVLCQSKRQKKTINLVIFIIDHKNDLLFVIKLPYMWMKKYIFLYLQTQPLHLYTYVWEKKQQMKIIIIMNEHNIRILAVSLEHSNKMQLHQKVNVWVSLCVYKHRRANVKYIHMHITCSKA